MGDRSSYGFTEGLVIGMSKDRSGPLMVFDWDKAARIIKGRKPSSVEAGLSGDWDCTGGEIYRDGNPVPRDETYTYLASTWATPKMILDDEDIECWRPKSDECDWGSDTYWPESALAILASADTHPEGGDAKQAPFMGSAVGEAETPNPSLSEGE